MAPSSCIMHVYLIFFLTLSLLSFPSQPADPDPLQDFCVADIDSPLSINGYPCRPPSLVTSNDFSYRGLVRGGTEFNMFGSNVTFGSVTQFPGLNTLGISMNRVDVLPGGINPPHSHPRASEEIIVFQGRIFAGFISTDNVLYANVVGPGENFVFPRGLIHFQLNIGRGMATFFPAFNSQNPGVQVTSLSLFASNPRVPDEVLSIAFQVDPGVTDEIRSNLSYEDFEFLSRSGFFRAA